MSSPSPTVARRGSPSASTAKLVAQKAAASLASAPDTGTLGKATDHEALREGLRSAGKLNGGGVANLRGLTVLTALDSRARRSPSRQLGALPNKGATPILLSGRAEPPSARRKGRRSDRLVPPYARGDRGRGEAADGVPLIGRPSARLREDFTRLGDVGRCEEMLGKRPVALFYWLCDRRARRPADAGGWQEMHETSDDVKIEVHADGQAEVQHHLRYRIVAGHFKSFDLVGVDPRAIVVAGDRVHAREDRRARQQRIPARVEAVAKTPGTLRIMIDEGKGLGRGSYVVDVKYKLDLVATKMLTRDGAMWKLAWTAPLRPKGTTAPARRSMFPQARPSRDWRGRASPRRRSRRSAGPPNAMSSSSFVRTSLAAKRSRGARASIRRRFRASCRPSCARRPCSNGDPVVPFVEPLADPLRGGLALLAGLFATLLRDKQRAFRAAAEARDAAVEPLVPLGSRRPFGRSRTGSPPRSPWPRSLVEPDPRRAARRRSRWRSRRIVERRPWQGRASAVRGSRSRTRRRSSPAEWARYRPTAWNVAQPRARLVLAATTRQLISASPGCSISRPRRCRMRLVHSYVGRARPALRHRPALADDADADRPQRASPPACTRCARGDVEYRARRSPHGRPRRRRVGGGGTDRRRGSGTCVSRRPCIGSVHQTSPLITQ